MDAERVELVVHPARDVAHARERRAVQRVEIDGGEVHVATDCARENQGSCEIDASWAM